MALYFYFNETTGDLVYSDQATYSVDGYTSLGQQTQTNPAPPTDWIFDAKRANIKTVTKDPNISAQIDILNRMNYMFDSCSALTSLDLSGFDTSNVTAMRGMFGNCNTLTSLDVSGFNTSNVTNMEYVFHGCEVLTSLDLSGFDTSNVIDMSGMFQQCRALISLDLSGFDTSNVVDMAGMFNDCDALTSLDLSGFDTSHIGPSHIGSVDGMFSNCQALRIIDISPNMSNALEELPAAQYYPAAGGDPVSKADLTAGTWVRDEADLSMVTSIVEQAQMSQAISRRIGKLNRDLRAEISKASSGSTTPSVDVVRTEEHKTSYDRDTLEIVTDSTGKVTEMYFVSA